MQQLASGGGEQFLPRQTFQHVPPATRQNLASVKQFPNPRIRPYFSLDNFLSKQVEKARPDFI
jgi:hypothetical protein